MWLSGQHVAHHWGNVKRFVGQAYSEGSKWAGALDHAANVGMRLFGAAAPLLGGGALEGGIRAIDSYQGARNRVAAIDSSAREAAQRFRSAAPELF